MPEAGTVPISWKVESVDSPSSRSLVGPEFDDEGNPTPIATGSPSNRPAPRPGNGGEGQANGIWADYTYTDSRATRRPTAISLRAPGSSMPKRPTGTHGATGTTKETTSTGSRAANTSSAPYYPEQIGDNVISSATASTFVIEYPTHDKQEDLLLAYNYVNTTDPQVDLNQPVALRFSHGLAAVRSSSRPPIRTPTTLLRAGFRTPVRATSPPPESSPTDRIPTRRASPGSTATIPPVTERIYYWKNSGVEFSTDPTAGTSTPAMAYTRTGTSEGELFAQNNGWVLILPQQSSGNLQFCFTTQSGEEGVYRVSIPKVTERIKASDGSVVESTDYLPGKRYTYTISITETNLILDLTVADWNERESSHSIVF